MPYRAQDFRNRLRISRDILPQRRMRARLPRKVPPKSVALSYYRAIAPILEAARDALMRAIEPLLPALEAEARAVRGDARVWSNGTTGAFEAPHAGSTPAARTDASKLNDILDAIGKEFFERLKPAEIEAVAERFARATSEWEKEQAAKQVRAAFGVDVLTQEPRLAGRTSAFISENVALIKSIPSQFFDDVEKRVARAVSSGATAKELAAEISKAHGVADDRAMLIARDQIGKFHAAVAEARQSAMGVTHYIWRTSNDERVREEHAAREGETFAWDDPPEGGHPGEDFQCRCFAEPVLTPLLEGTEPLARAQEEPAVETKGEVERPAPPVPRNFVAPEGAPPIGRGVPSFEEARGAERAPLNVVRPSDLLGRIFSLPNTRPGGVENILDVWERGKRLGPIKVVIDEHGNMSVSDGRHRLIAALVEGKDRKLLIEFEHAPKGVDFSKDKNEVPVTKDLAKPRSR